MTVMPMVPKPCSITRSRVSEAGVVVGPVLGVAAPVVDAREGIAVELGHHEGEDAEEHGEEGRPGEDDGAGTVEHRHSMPGAAPTPSRLAFTCD